MDKDIKLNNTDWRNATGPIDYNMTNDYMFRMVLQSSKKVLKGLISSMMYIPTNDINSVEILNPIEPGKSIDGKTHILDIKVKLNDSSIINLEMQVLNEHNWTNRSLCYLCRIFDNVQKGEDYNSAIKVTHIGFLDFDLFQNDNEFYSKYMLLNVKSHRIYNDKFCLNVLSLNRIENATDEDKKWDIDTWTKLFKATTWEGLKMIAEKNDVYSEMADSMYYQNSDETIRDMCEARREAEFHEKYVQQRLKELEEAKREAEVHEKYVQQQLKELEKLKQLTKDKDATIQELTSRIKELEAQLKQN